MQFASCLYVLFATLPENNVMNWGWAKKLLIERSEKAKMRAEVLRELQAEQPALPALPEVVQPPAPAPALLDGVA